LAGSRILYIYQAAFPDKVDLDRVSQQREGDPNASLECLPSSYPLYTLPPTTCGATTLDRCGDGFNTTICRYLYDAYINVALPVYKVSCHIGLGLGLGLGVVAISG
jgi:hypothetical protein